MRDSAHALLIAALTAVMTLAGCGDAGVSLSPRPATPTVSLEATQAPTSPSPTSVLPEQPIITCALVLADGSLPPTKSLPETLPRSLPLDLVPSGATIYALTYPRHWTWKPEALYMVGPDGGTCEGWTGTGLGMIVRDTGGNVVVDYIEPLTVGPAQQLSCAYIEAARTGAEAEPGSLDPSFCSPRPGDRVTGIATGVEDFHLALVISSAQPWLGSTMTGPVASLYSFRRSADGERGTSWRVTCALSVLPASTCLAALAFPTGDSRDVATQIARALDVAVPRAPPTVAP